MNSSLNPSLTLSPRRRLPEPGEWVERIESGDRQALATAITVAESRLPEHRRLIEDLLRRLGPERGHTTRIGITGLPGAGKSTFIEALGVRLLNKGHNVAVLAIDPSRIRHQGSILADKTRMPVLSSHPDAFIRPTPSSGVLGGIAAATHESIRLCEAAGFDRILIETVGVGQSETTVDRVSDVIVLLLIPGAGDELQGLKGGILELADIVLVNKADGEGIRAAETTLADYKAAFHYGSPEHGRRLAMACSAVTGSGLDALLERLEALVATREAAGEKRARRDRQRLHLLDAQIRRRLEFDFFTDPEVISALEKAQVELERGESDLFTLADRLVKQFKHR